MTDEQTAALRRAIDYFGGHRALARAIGVTPPMIDYWLIWVKKGIPPTACIAIERETKGAVRKWELRPDVWPNARGYEECSPNPERMK